MFHRSVKMIKNDMIQKARELSIKLLSDYYSGFTLRHTFNMLDLFEKVISKLKEEESLKLRKDVITFSIILHDIGRIISEKNHSQISFDIVHKDFLGKISEEDMVIVKDCIVNHSSGMNPLSSEARLMQDIDKLSMLQPKIILEYMYHLSKEIALDNFTEAIKKMINKSSKHFNNLQVSLMYQKEYSKFIETIIESLPIINNGSKDET